MDFFKKRLIIKSYDDEAFVTSTAIITIMTKEPHFMTTANKVFAFIFTFPVCSSIAQGSQDDQMIQLGSVEQ